MGPGNHYTFTEPTDTQTDKQMDRNSYLHMLLKLEKDKVKLNRSYYVMKITFKHKAILLYLSNAFPLSFAIIDISENIFEKWSTIHDTMVL